MLKSMAESESSPTSKQSSPESTQRGDGEHRDTTRPAGESPPSGQVEQSVAAVQEVEAPESRYQAGLVGILSQMTSDPLEVHHAVEDLRGLIEATVRREIGVLRREMHVMFESFRREMDGKFESLRREMNGKFEAIEARFKGIEDRFKGIEDRFKGIESQLTMIRWMLGAIITLLVALIIVVFDMARSDDRSGTPLPQPQSVTVQAPTKTETVAPTGATPSNEASTLAAPGEPSVSEDLPADQPAP